MATTAKKKTATTKKTPAKKAPIKKTVAKKAAPAKKKTTSKKKQQLQSFRVYKDTQPFMTLRITDQTFYWLLIAVISIGFTARILKFQSDINDIYAQIESVQILDITTEPVTTEPAIEGEPES